MQRTQMLIGVILRNLRVLKEENVVFAIFQSFFLDGVHLSSRLQAVFKTTVYVVYIGSSTIIFKMLPVSVAEWESAFKVFFSLFDVIFTFYLLQG